MTPKRTRTLDLSPAATFAHILPLELIANSTFATIIFTLKGHVCPPLPPLGKGKGALAPRAGYINPQCVRQTPRFVVFR